jgi:hypothetical protein
MSTMNLPDQPGERSFPNREDARWFIRDEAARHGVLVPITDEVADEITQELRLIALSRTAPVFPPRFVIRDDDIKLLEAVQTAAGAGATVAFGTASASATALAGIFTAAVLLIVKVQKKGCELGRDDVDVLAALAAGPMHSYDLRHTLNSRRVPALQVTEQVFDKTLEGLQKKRLADGSVVALVAQDGRGLWSAIPHHDVTWLMPE